MNKVSIRLKNVSRMIEPRGIYKYKVHSITRDVCAICLKWSVRVSICTQSTSSKL